MRILIVTQYFWPENFRVNDLVEQLARDGHEVAVLTGLPNYPEGRINPVYAADPEAFNVYHGAQVFRAPHSLRGTGRLSLMLNYFSFFLSASTMGAWKLRRRPFDVIFVFAVSPITVAIPAIVLRWLKRAPVFLWVQDLWPETLAEVGVVRSSRVLALVGLMVRWIYARCDTILIQSKSFSASVERLCKNAKEGKIVYFPNWAEDIFAQDAAEAIHAVANQRFTVLFAGNMGEAQDFPGILAVAEGLKDNANICWKIVGDGRQREWVVAEIARRGLSHCVEWLGRHPVSAMPRFYASADALLVVLKPGDIFARTVPSKLQSYLAAGRPILGMINGETRRIIEESGAGFACHASDTAELMQLVVRMSTMSAAERAGMGERGRTFYKENFDRVTLFKRLQGLFELSLRRKNQSH